ncbi:RpiR family transcriptional regulator [Azorhizobium oxalatiphilum]|uniref:RpiR family transcriptional regulator n=1 Tax=Azorhizobium oxalatiphilum TaxID=980631 RepID=A0A917F4Q5_9HYPH|nr:MurR/RpiR family transcriptional regulator [Azorhizobium oxalatiphilum]GGF50151.1 RpiR family transcriptional regulator [Azorhizobium oxalatiphilum]
MTTLIERLEARQADLTARERDIARYLAENYPQAVLQSASAIGRTTGISAATVVRFFAKLGYASFSQAQEDARREVALKLSSPIDRMGVVDSPSSSNRDFLIRYQEVEIDNLKSTFAQLDPAQMEGLVEAILGAKGRVFIVGEKDSYAVAYFIYTHLNLCLPNVTLLETGQSMVADRLLWAGADDLLICVSIRRYCPSGIRVAEHFRDQGAKVVALSDSPLSPLLPLATHRLLVQTVSLSVFDSFTALMSVAGAMVGLVARMRREPMHATLQRGQELWNRFNTFLT